MLLVKHLISEKLTSYDDRFSVPDAMLSFKGFQINYSILSNTAVQSTDNVFSDELLNTGNFIYFPNNTLITHFCYPALLYLPIHFLMFKYFVLCTDFVLWIHYRKK